MDLSALTNVDMLSRINQLVTDEEIIRNICDLIQTRFPNIERMKGDVELIIFICNLIENICFDNGIKKSQAKPNYKLDLAIAIFQRLGIIKNQEDRQQLENAIHSIHSLGQIKKIPFFKKLIAAIKRWIQKKLG